MGWLLTGGGVAGDEVAGNLVTAGQRVTRWVSLRGWWLR